MPSDIDIVNQALVMLGDAAIAAFTDNNDRARIASRFYTATRDAVLRAHPWNFAIVRRSLAREVATPEFGYPYQFTLPTIPLCLRILGVNEDTPGNITYQLEGRKLLTEEESIKIKYVGQVTDPNLFDSLFIDAFVARLATKFCLGLTKEKTLLEMCFKMYERTLQEAKTINGMEGTRPALISNDLINARRGGTSEYVYSWELP